MLETAWESRRLIAQGRMDAVVWGWCELCGGEYDCELTLTEKLE